VSSDWFQEFVNGSSESQRAMRARGQRGAASLVFWQLWTISLSAWLICSIDASSVHQEVQSVDCPPINTTCTIVGTEEASVAETHT
jgi:hypothetical protein